MNDRSGDARRIPSRWLELRVRDRAAPEEPDLLVEALLALGARAAQEIDGWLVTAIEEPSDPGAFVEHAATTLREMSRSATVELETSWRSAEDWAETWKRGLEPRWITERLLVRPSWAPVASDRPHVEIVIDPGMAFGTAEHATTRGCLRLLDRVVQNGDRVLDVGSGSGILAIAAAGLGATSVVAIEADRLACEALRENIERNGVGDRVRCVEAMVVPDDLARMGPASGVIANIESGPLTTLMPGFAAAVEPGGWLVLSGILDHEWPSMGERAAAAGFRMQELDAEAEWRAALLLKPLASSPPP